MAQAQHCHARRRRRRQHAAAFPAASAALAVCMAAAAAVGAAATARVLAQAPAPGLAPVATDGAAAAPQVAPAQKFVLEPLPYAYDALEPVIIAKIMQLHHDFHDGVEYVGTLNGVLGPLAGSGRATLPDLVGLVMAPPGSANASRSAISAPLQSAIDSAFGSVDDMLSRFKLVADAHFGGRAGRAYGPKKPDYTAAWLTIINWAQVSANFDAAGRNDLAFIGTAF